MKKQNNRMKEIENTARAATRKRVNNRKRRNRKKNSNNTNRVLDNVGNKVSTCGMAGCKGCVSKSVLPQQDFEWARGLNKPSDAGPMPVSTTARLQEIKQRQTFTTTSTVVNTIANYMRINAGVYLWDAAAGRSCLRDAPCWSDRLYGTYTNGSATSTVIPTSYAPLATGVFGIRNTKAPKAAATTGPAYKCRTEHIKIKIFNDSEELYKHGLFLCIQSPTGRFNEFDGKGFDAISEYQSAVLFDAKDDIQFSWIPMVKRGASSQLEFGCTPGSANTTLDPGGEMLIMFNGGGTNAQTFRVEIEFFYTAKGFESIPNTKISASPSQFESFLSGIKVNQLYSQANTKKQAETNSHHLVTTGVLSLLESIPHTVGPALLAAAKSAASYFS